MRVDKRPTRARGSIARMASEARTKGFLARLAPEVVDLLIDSSTMIDYPVGAVVSPVRAAIVLLGLLGYVLLEPDGRQLTIRYVGPGDLVGTMGSREAEPITGAEAIEPSVLVQLEPDLLRSIAARRPEVGLAMIDELTGRLRSAYRTLASMSFGTVRSRIARDLIERARAGPGLRPGAEVQVTQQDLGQSVGSVREVVARSLAQLRDAQVIASHRSSITILDLTRLLHEAHQSAIDQSGSSEPPSTATARRTS